MATTQIALPAPRKPFRLWPGIVAVVLQWIGWFVVPAVLPWSQAPFIGLLVGVLGGLAILLWWLLFSRAPWVERIGAPVLIVGAVILTKRVVHPSIAGGAMGVVLYVYCVPPSFGCCPTGILLALWPFRGFGPGLVRWAAAARSGHTGKPTSPLRHPQ